MNNFQLTCSFRQTGFSIACTRKKNISGKIYFLNRQIIRSYKIRRGNILLTVGVHKKVKVNCTLEEATKAQRGSRDIALLVL